MLLHPLPSMDTFFTPTGLLHPDWAALLHGKLPHSCWALLLCTESSTHADIFLSHPAWAPIPLTSPPFPHRYPPNSVWALTPYAYTSFLVIFLILLSLDILHWAIISMEMLRFQQLMPGFPLQECSSQPAWVLTSSLGRHSSPLILLQHPILGPVTPSYAEGDTCHAQLHFIV